MTNSTPCLFSLPDLLSLLYATDRLSVEILHFFGHTYIFTLATEESLEMSLLLGPRKHQNKHQQSAGRAGREDCGKGEGKKRRIKESRERT